MLDKINGKFILMCDVCLSDHEEAFESFEDAILEARLSGWRTTKIDDEWMHTCPECQEQ